MHDVWEVFAIHYGTVELSGSHLGLAPDLHNCSGRLEYFVWLARNKDRLVLIDTGFEKTEGARRGRQIIEMPEASLENLGISPADISDIVITHLHYDHAGNLNKYPNARFHLQDKELAYATGRCMCYQSMRRPFSVDDILETVKLVYKERVDFHEGDFTLYPGLDVFLVGGHSMGLQIVRAQGAERPIIVASDALHLKRYLNDNDVFPVFGNLVDTLEGYRKLKSISGSNGLILPGHDPSVLRDFNRIDLGRKNIYQIK